MAREKIHTVKIKEKNRKIQSVLLTIALIAFLLQFDWACAMVQKLFPNVPCGKLKFAASVTFWTATGVAMLSVGATTAAIPYVGAAFSVIGGVIIITQAIRIWNRGGNPSKIIWPDDRSL